MVYYWSWDHCLDCYSAWLFSTSLHNHPVWWGGGTGNFSAQPMSGELHGETGKPSIALWTASGLAGSGRSEGISVAHVILRFIFISPENHPYLGDTYAWNMHVQEDIIIFQLSDTGNTQNHPIKIKNKEIVIPIILPFWKGLEERSGSAIGLLVSHFVILKGANRLSQSGRYYWG